jgi:hypothetical protein
MRKPMSREGGFAQDYCAKKLSRLAKRRCSSALEGRGIPLVRGALLFTRRRGEEAGSRRGAESAEGFGTAQATPFIAELPGFPPPTRRLRVATQSAHSVIPAQAGIQGNMGQSMQSHPGSPETANRASRSLLLALDPRLHGDDEEGIAGMPSENRNTQPELTARAVPPRSLRLCANRLLLLRAIARAPAPARSRRKSGSQAKAGKEPPGIPAWAGTTAWGGEMTVMRADAPPDPPARPPIPPLRHPRGSGRCGSRSRPRGCPAPRHGG